MSDNGADDPKQAPRGTKFQVKPSPTTDVLYIYDSRFKRLPEVKFAKAIYNITDQKKIIARKTWPDLAKAIGKFSRIDTLILSYHGAPGQLSVGGTHRGIGESPVKKDFQKVKTVVGAIHIESCNIAQDPVGLAGFGSLLQATTVSGFTWYGVHEMVKIKVGKGSTSADVAKLRRRFEKFFVDAPSAEEMADSPRTYQVYTLWYRSELSTDQPPEPDPTSLGPRRPFKPRSEAKEREVTVDGAPAIKAEYADMMDDRRPFEHITVRLKK